MSSTRVRHHVNAPRARVYSALIDANAIAAWKVPTGMTSHVHSFEGREGGTFRISLTYDAPTGTGKTAAHTDTYHGRFVELVPNERVVEVVEFETAGPALRGEMTVTTTLTDVDGGTEVLAVHDGLPPGLSIADNEEGWRLSLAKLAALVEADEIRDSYDSAAEAYAEHLATELVHKPLDRHLLHRFAEDARGRGLVADLGCGPGHVARYLQEQGVMVVGIDLSPEMVRVAAGLHPGIEFRVGDMNGLDLPDASLVGVVAFYSIVHLRPAELGAVFQEVRRVLMPGGLALISFHMGDEVVHVDDLFGSPVSLDFRFHVPGDVIEALRSAQLKVIEHVEREPYEGAEYPSRRCYLFARSQA